jgi:hypothetical protein
VGVWFGKGLDGADGDESLHADGRVRVGLGDFRSLRTEVSALRLNSPRVLS